VRNAFALIAVVATAACGRDGGSAGDRAKADPDRGAAPAPRDPLGERAAAERACRSAMEATRPEPDTIRTATCAALYRGRCRDAWTAVGQRPEAATALIDECAAEYCADLGEPKPAACRPDATPRDSDMLLELDRAVLIHGGTERSLATVLAYRGRFFMPITTQVPSVVVPSADPPGITITVDKTTITVDGQPATLPELEKLVELMVKADAHTQFLLQADGTIQHGRLVEVMEAIKRAGGTSIALSTK
jgi:biopolymer transport protein ExbD